jgi:dTDP-4-amino-4,6-dideoxygalactose transaminase
VSGAQGERRGRPTTRLSVWPPLPTWVYARPRNPELPFPLADPRCQLFALGRHALWHGVRSVEPRPNDEVLVPVYHHGSEIEALLQAGLSCRFYAGSAGLEPDAEELDRLLSARTRALLLVHYLGFPQDARRWRRWCDERDLLLIEDAAQAWLASRDGMPVGSSGDISIFCLYKTVGLPDGAALVAPQEAPRATSRRPSLAPGPLVRRHVASWRSRSSLLGGLGRPRAPAARLRPEDEFALGNPHATPSLGTRSLLTRVALTSAASRRRANYAYLLESLGDHVAVPFAELPPGASPFVFPLETTSKARVVSRLAESGIYAFDFWSLAHPALERADSARLAALRDRIVGLPVHQELRAGDLERIAAAARAAVGTPRARAQASA